MSELKRYVKADHPDRLVSTVAGEVHAEYDGFKLAEEDAGTEVEAKPTKAAAAKKASE